MILDTTTKSLEIDLDEAHTTNAMPITVDYVDLTASATTGGSSDTQSNGTTAVTILSAPAASTQRKVNFASVYNADTVTHNVTIQLNNNATLRTITKATISAGETLQYTDTIGWELVTSTGVYLPLANLGTGVATFLATPSSANLASALTDEIGTAGSVMFGEQGTFTPVIVGSTGAGVGTYTQQSGKYQKVGNVVDYKLAVVWTAHTGTGNLRINTGFTASNDGQDNSCKIGFFNNIALTAGNVATAIHIVNTEYVALYQYPTGGGASVVVPIDTAGTIELSGKVWL